MAVTPEADKAAAVAEKEAGEGEQSTEKSTEDKMYSSEEKPSEETPDDKSTEDKAAEDKAVEDKAAEDKQAEDKSEKDDKDATTEGVVVVDDLKFPEGVPVDEGIRDQFLEVVNDKDMSAKDRAQKLVSIQQSLNVKAQEAHNAIVDGWAEEAGSDPEIVGADGAKKDENLALSNKGMNALEIEGLKDLLISSGYGNHPIFIKTFMKIGAMVSDDKFVASSGKGSSREDMTVGERMFGKDGKGK